MSYIGNQPTSVAFLTDQFSGTGSQTAFTLSAAPANTASIIVAVSGVLQDPTTYSTSGLTLTFSAAPPSGTGNISVRFLGIPASNIATTAYRTLTEFTATAGQTTFTVPSYTVGYISVYRNGVMLGTADFTATSGTTVVLATAATAGDLITTESFYVSSVLNAIPAVANAVTDTYINTGAVTQTKIATGVGQTGPAFCAGYVSGSPFSITSNVFTKIQFNTELYDTNNCYDPTTNYRFTPNVAGYYVIGAFVDAGANTNTVTNMNLAIYKNGSLTGIVGGPYGIASGYLSEFTASGSILLYFNGTTDYVECYIRINGTSPVVYSGTNYTQWYGHMVRAA